MKSSPQDRADVLFFQATSFPGGAEKSGLELASALERLGLSVLFLVGGEGPVADRALTVLKRVAHVHLPPIVRPRLQNFSIAGIARAFAEIPRSVLRLRRISSNARVLYANGDHALLYAAFSGVSCPILYHARDVRLKGRLLKSAAGRAARIIAVSDFVARHLVEHGVLEARVAVIHNGIDTAYYSDVPSRQEARSLLGLPLDSPIVLWLGNMVAWKRPLAFIEAAKEMGAQALFVMAGGTHYLSDKRGERTVEDAARRAGVKVFGYAEDPRPYYAAADVFVSTSAHEPFGRVLVEAMAAGCPVVSTREGGKPEIIDDGADGLLVPPNDTGALVQALGSLLRNAKLRRNIARRAADKARKLFDVSRCAARVADVLREVMRPAQ